LQVASLVCTQAAGGVLYAAASNSNIYVRLNQITITGNVVTASLVR